MLFSFSGAFANVILPGSEGIVEALSFMPSALADLEAEGKFVLFNENGVPYGFVDNGVFTESLDFGGLTITPPTGDTGSIIGGYSMQDASDTLAGMRMEQGDDLDWEILRQQDFLKYAYYSQRYGDFETFIKEGLGIDSKQEGIDFMNSLSPNAANEFMSIYEALDIGEAGNSHYQQLLDALNQINDQDLSKYLDEDTLKQVEDVMKNLKTDLAKELLENVLKNIGEEELKMLYNLLKEIDYQTLYEIARDYARELARDGTLDEIGETIKDSGIGDEAMDAFQNSAKEFLKNQLWDIMPKDAGYYVLAVAMVVLVFVLRGVGG
ncbi:MAG: hypothetical protein GOV00_00485 [Candidatus Altiarchaeota archaeon]|nr:hypothetical protein [Candidatus Altiarchaeota archaeon]